MKKLFFCLISFLCLLILPQYTSGQNFNWITPNKTYLKLYLAEDGIYRLNRADFTNAGVNTNGIDPRTIKVLYKGSQVPVYFEGELDGSFDANDFFDFYGIRNYGGSTKHYTDNNILNYTTNEWFNLYSDTSIYWIDWGGQNGIRMQTSNFSTSVQYPVAFYYDIVHFEKDKYYSLGESIYPGDFRNFTNEIFLGEGWYWNLLNNINGANNPTVSDTSSLPLLYSTAQNASLRVFAYPNSISTSISNEHNLQFKINGNLISSINSNDNKRIDTTLNFSSSLLSNASVNTVSATYTAAPGFENGGAMNFDMFELQYPKIFKFRNNQIAFQLSGSDTASKQFSISGFTPSSPVSIYDVVNGIKINAYSNNSDTLKFAGKSNSKFEIINKHISKKPFRIKQRQVPDYVSASNGVDYLLVYNSMFEAQALELKNHRETFDKFRVTIAEIENIYDIFNFGFEGPVGLKNFTKYVYNNWTLPKVKYICLFGRGSLDPKKNSSATVYTQNLIPVIGHPTSDNYFANFNGNTFTFYNQVAIGRLPALTESEAQNIVNNIFTYETQTPKDWWKSFTYIAGGIDSVEQAQFLPLNNDSIINPYVLPPSVSGNPVRIFRNDFNGGITYNFSDSIKNQINRGTLTVNFMGHAGSQDWELGMTDPNVLSNYEKFPLIFSMTCYTGKIAEPNFRVFGEKFMTMNNKGAVGYIGTSGWGYLFSGSVLNNLMMKAIAKDTIRRIGDILAYATKRLAADSTSSSVRHTINCYTLQGDPAVKLSLPKNPEYSISINDYKLSEQNPVINRNVTLTAYIRNFGLHSDSCKIRFTLTRNLRNYLTKDTVLRNFKFYDSVKYIFALADNDIYSARIFLDYPNSNPKEDKNNNVIDFNLSPLNVAFIPVKPINNSVIKSDTVELKGLNPFAGGNKNIKVVLELDTSKYFNSPVRKIFVKSGVTGASTSFKTPLPALDTGALYYWRTNTIINGDSAGWYSNQIFKYDPLISFETKEFAAGDTSVIVKINKKDQYNGFEFQNTNSNSGSVKLNDYTGNLLVRSLGSSGTEASYFNVMNKSIHIDAGKNTGLNLLKIRKLDGAILEFKNIRMTFPNSTDSVLAFLNTFDTTHYLMGLNAAYVPSAFLLNANTINKFAQFGSTMVQSFRIGWFDTWSFIGFLNASPSEVSEAVHNYLFGPWIESVSSLNRTFKYINGTVTYNIGPANYWDKFSWQQSLFQGGSIKFDVYGVDRNSNQNLLLSNVTSSSLVNLSAFSAYQYPNLNLTAKLSIDTINGSRSPELSSFKIYYTPPPEIIPLISSFSKSDSSSKVGDELKIKFDYYNPGNLNVPGVIVNLYKTSIALQNKFKSDTILSLLKADSSMTYNKKFTVPYFRFSGSSKVKFFIEILPAGQNNEFYSFNNSFDFDLELKQNTIISNVDVFFDGQLVQNGDYVRHKPEIKIQFKDPKIDLASDTAGATILINNRVVPLLTGKEIEESLESLNQGKQPARRNSNNEFYFYPELNSGENILKITTSGSNGIADTIKYSVIVSDEFLVKEFYNFPNPMKDGTTFIINLSGSDNLPESKIRIYTVAGKLIKEINFNFNVGYNQIAWDGRDNDGDVIANGIYLYKLVCDNNLMKESEIQKLVVLK